MVHSNLPNLNKIPANISSHTVLPCSLLFNCILRPPVAPNPVVDVSPLECVYRGEGIVMVKSQMDCLAHIKGCLLRTKLLSQYFSAP